MSALQDAMASLNSGQQPTEQPDEGVLGAVMHFLSTPENLGAGAIEGMMHGKGPIQGAAEGWKNKAQYGDILREMGAPEWAASVGGLAAATVTDPLTWLGGAVAERGAKLALPAAEAGVQSVEDILRGARAVNSQTAATLDAYKNASTVAQKAITERAIPRFIVNAYPEERRAEVTARIAEWVDKNGPESINSIADEFRTKFPKQGAQLDKYIERSVIRGTTQEVRKLLPTIGKTAQETLPAGPEFNKNPRGFWAGITNEWNQDVRRTSDYLYENAQLNAGPIPVGRILSHGLDTVENFAHRLQGGLLPRTFPIMALNEDEAKLAFNAIDAGIDPKTLPMKVQNAIEAHVGLDKEYYTASSVRGVLQLDENGKLVPLKFRQNHVPHFTDPKAVNAVLKDGGPEYDAMIDEVRRLAGEKPGVPIMTPAEADSQLRAYLYGEKEFDTSLHSGFQLARTIKDLPYETDLRKVTMRSLPQNARRIAMAEVFGGQDEIYKALRPMIGQAIGSQRADLINAVVRQTAGESMNIDQATRKFMKFASAGTFNWGTGILQHSQIAQSITHFGWQPTLRGVGLAMFNPDFRAAVKSSGALLDQEAIKALDMQGMLGNMLGINQQDSFQRTIAAGASWNRLMEIGGEIHSLTNDSLRGFAKVDVSHGGGRLAMLGRELKSMGLNAEDFIQKGGVPNREDILTAMRNGVRETQHRNAPVDLPLGMQKYGPLVYLWRKFSLQQGSAFVHHVVREAAAGNYAPAARAVTTMPALFGVALGVDAARGRVDSPTFKIAKGEATGSDYAKVATSNAMLGLFGIWGDMMGQALMAGNVGDLAGTVITGPTAGVLSDWTAPVSDLAFKGGRDWLQGNDTDVPSIEATAISKTAKRTPYLGPILKAYENFSTQNQ